MNPSGEKCCFRDEKDNIHAAVWTPHVPSDPWALFYEELDQRNSADAGKREEMKEQRRVSEDEHSRVDAVTAHHICQ